jgi:ubiquinone/menaquinone biosynthesis C-methylase UbiE
MGYLLLSPFRYLTQNPTRLLAPYVSNGMKVLDVGCGPGFFSLPLAHLVGESGKVYCVDLQPRMIAILQGRARKAGLQDRIEALVCQKDTLGLHTLEPEVDFVLAFGVVHEVPDKARLFAELAAVMKPGASLLVVEPKGVVRKGELERILDIAQGEGFDLGTRLVAGSRYGVRLIKESL